MATIHLPKDFKEFLRLLNAHNVEYLLIGGYAVGYHGYPRATADMDIWVASNPPNSQKLMVVLKEFGFESAHLSASLFLKPNKIIHMGMPPLRIEINTGISGLAFEKCFPERVAGNLDGVPVQLISLKHLKINKQKTGCAKDINDLENLP